MGALTYNGEIYNFREIARKRDLRTDSDSEVLFYMIDSIGIEAALGELDGDYAFAYASEGRIQLARDPAGVKPLFTVDRRNFSPLRLKKKPFLPSGSQK